MSRPTVRSLLDEHCISGVGAERAYAELPMTIICKTTPIASSRIATHKPPFRPPQSLQSASGPCLALLALTQQAQQPNFRQPRQPG
jgi:hypothetical protein